MKRKTGRLLTVAQLNEKGACDAAVEYFQELFGNSVKVTKTNAVKHSSSLNIRWAGHNLLSDKRVEQFERFANRTFDRSYNERPTLTYRQAQKLVAAEFARLYNLEG